MRSVDMMREWASSGKLYSDTERFVLHFADEIEREIEERFMELPVDADGVPIRVGDKLEFGKNRNQGIVKALNEHMVIAMHVDDGYTNYAKFGLLWNADECRHVKSDMLKELLDDVSKGIICYPRERVTGYLEDNHSIGEAVMLDVRDRLSKLLGGDAE